MNDYLYKMNLKFKKRLIWFSGILVLCFLVVLIVNYSLQKKLEASLQKVPDNIHIAYKDINLNALTGTLELWSPNIEFYGKNTNALIFKASLESFCIKGFNFFSFFKNKNIALNQIEFSQPKLTYFHNDVVENKAYNIFESKNIQDLEIASVNIIDGEIEIYQASNDSLMLKTEAIHFNMQDFSIVINSDKPKVTCKAYSIKADHLFCKISPFEDLRFKEFELNPEIAHINEVVLNTKYTKKALLKHTKVEKDHYGLSIDSIAIKTPSFGFEHDTLFYFKTPKTTVYNAVFNVFRNKLLPDQIHYKPMYSNLLRDLNFNLGVDVLSIKNTSINYIEKIKLNSKGGRLQFSNLNADIKNIGKFYDEKTLVEIDAIFMENTPLKVYWEFDINDDTDAFIFKSEIGKLQANHLNQFMKPNLNVKLEGEFDRLYFTIDGNENMAQTDLKVDYKNFDVIILQDDGKEKNRLLSAVLNVFISKDSEDENGVFRYGKSDVIERDKTKSTFNFVWVSLKAALLDAITGNGEKE